MNEHGFKFIKSRGVYIRRQPYGFDDFIWGSYSLIATQENPPYRYYEGHYGVGVRHDAIEELTSEVMPIYGTSNQKYAFTIHRDVGGYFPFDKNRDYVMKLRYEELEKDATAIAERIKAMLLSDGFEWYEHFASPLSLSQGLNNTFDTMESHSVLNNPQSRPLVGVAAACVAEPDRVQDLIEGYLKYARSEDKKLSEKRSPVAPDMETKFNLIVTRAKELGILH